MWHVLAPDCAVVECDYCGATLLSPDGTDHYYYWFRLHLPFPWDTKHFCSCDCLHHWTYDWAHLT
jgi:hypothetical protein